MSDAVAAVAAQPVPFGHSAWKDPAGFGFRDLLDIVNPLQHLPIIGSIYRYLTGDRPGDVAKVVGDGLYGGPIGLVVGAVGAATEDKQGRDLGERAMAAVFGKGGDTGATAVASAAPAPAANPAKPPPAQTTAPPAVPDHAPIALFGGIALPVPPARPAGSTIQPGAAASQFLVQKAALEHGIPPAVPAQRPTPPVPLALEAGTLDPGKPGAMPLSIPPATPSGQPKDISQKMLDALDKYMRLEKGRKVQAPAGAAAPDAAAPVPATVDLSL